MVNNRLKKIVSLLMVLSIALCGCGSKPSSGTDYSKMNKKELIAEINKLKAEKTDLSILNSDYRLTLESLESMNSSKPSIYGLNDGTGNLSFNAYDSKIIFPSSFSYPGTSELATTSTISIVNNITIAPSSNWVTRLSGTGIELSHSNGISGVIKIGSITSTYNKDALEEEVLKPWLDELTTQKVRYSNIFIDSNDWGKQAQTQIFIDEEPAILTCGMFSFSTYSFVYVFVYRGNEDLNKNEAIKTLLNDMRILNLKVSVE